MKRLLAIMLVLCCALSFFGCGKNTKPDENNQVSESASAAGNTQETGSVSSGTKSETCVIQSQG